jgi:hypothetical protein
VYPHSGDNASHLTVAPSLELETLPSLEELSPVFSMAEDFSSPPVGALGLSSQAVSASERMEAAAIPQAMLVNFFFMMFLL